jgi:CRISPR/Cas system-associated exonuclease Cas4 (RecB family)
MVYHNGQYLSYTGFMKLEECSEAYRLEYIERKRPKVEDARNNIHGNVLHNMLEEWIKRGQDDAAAWFPRNVEGAWHEQLAKEQLVVWRTPTDMQEVYEKTASWAGNLGVMLEKYKIDPNTCEPEFKADMDVKIAGKQVRLGGRIDILKTNKAGNKVIFDLKASINRQIMKREQLVWYSLLVGMKLKNHDEPTVAGYLLPGLEEVIMHQITREDKTALLNRIHAALTKIESKDFKPSPGSACFWCPVKHACPVKGEAIPSGTGMIDLSTIL